MASLVGNYPIEAPRAGRQSKAAPASIVGPDDRLFAGIWPKSLAVWMVGAYVALFIIRPWELLFPELGAIRFERLFAMAMLFSVVLEGFCFRMSGQAAAVLAFLTAFTLSTLFAFNVESAFGPFYTYVTLVVFFFVMLSVVRTPYTLCFLVTCYIVAMAMYLSKSLWEFFLNDAHIYAMGVRRLVGVDQMFGGPNEVAGSIVLSMPMLMFLFSVRKSFTASWPRFYRRWFPRCLAAYFVIAMAALVLTNSRSGMVGFALFVGLVAMRSQGMLNKILCVVGGLLLLVALWIVMPQDTKDRIATLWDPSRGPANAHESAMGRLAGFRIGMAIFQRFPVLGVGPGNFIPYRQRHIDGGKWDPHNLPGQALSEVGLVGTGLFALMMLVALRNAQLAIRLGQQCQDPRALVPWKLAYAARETLVILCFDGLSGHNMQRFTWLWTAAFALIAVWQLRALMREQRMAVYTQPLQPEPAGVAFA